MIIKKIKLKNIRSYEEEEVEFPTGSVVLAGDIGSGKTTILLAIEFALFGLQPGQRGSSLLRHGKEEGSVLLEIEIDGKKIEIERTLKRGKSVNQGETYLTIDGERKERAVSESKNLILGILNYPKEFAKKTNLLYKFTVYTPQEEMKQIILESSDSRLDTLRHIFGIDKYKRVVENSEVFFKNLRERIREHDGQVKDLEELKKNREFKEENAKNLRKILETERQELAERVEEKNNIEKDIEKIRGIIEEKKKYEQEAEKSRIMAMGKREMLARLKREKLIIQKQMEEVDKLKFEQTELEIILSSKKQLERRSEDGNKEYMELVGAVNSMSMKVKDNEKMKTQISSLHFCPTCLQQVGEDYKQNLVNKFDEEMTKGKKQVLELESRKKNILEILAGIKKNILEIEKKAEEIKFAKIRLEAIKEKQERMSEIGKQENITEQDISLLEQQILSLKESAAELKKYDQVFDFKNKELEDARRKENERAIRVAGTAKEIELTLINIEEMKIKIEEKQKIKARIIYLREIEDWVVSHFVPLMRFTERNIMLKLRDEFSKLFNEWFNVLVPDIFRVRLDEDFTPLIEQQDYQVDYGFMSGGERTAIALAYRLALNQTINSLMSKIKTKDLVILDEPTDGFSEQQLDKMRDVLQELKVQQLIIVSHETKIESFVENIIKFRKENGVSFVERGKG